jgi:pSer/pThr/pTyr-binding forkhead associated (FHA) protein
MTQPAGLLPAEAAPLLLRFISGKYKGGEFPVPVGARVVIGRAANVDVVLVEDLVSRRHAEFEHQGDCVLLRDLDSTNGTFVNGERIRERVLEDKDRVLIGTSILKLVFSEGLRTTPASAQRRLADLERSRGTARAPRMAGELEEIPLADLLQLLSNARKNGCLRVRGAAAFGKIHLAEGRVVHAELVHAPGLHPRKAFFRLLCTAQGRFSLEEPESLDFAGPLSHSAEELLMEAMREHDELAQLASRLPNAGARFVVPSPLKAPLEELEESELELMRAALIAPSYAGLLDRRPEPDLEIGRVVIQLLERGYLGVAAR